MERALAVAPAPTRPRAAALIGLTGLDSRQGRSDRHRTLGAQALDIVRQIGTAQEVVMARLVDTALAWSTFDLDDAERLAGEVRSEAIDLGHPEIAVIALTTFQEPQQVTAALAAGARGYLVKDIEPEVLVAGIRAAVNGGAPLSPSVAAQLIRNASSQPNSGSSLTQRERQILHLIVGGKSNKQIGRELGISEKTVKSHCGRLFQRINVSDRRAATVWANKNMPVNDG